MTRPFFSIVTVTFRNRSGVEKTRSSVEAQQFGDFEWIVVDGGSTDGTVELLQGIADPRLRIVSEPDKGLYDAMRKGLARAQGAYTIFMNAGDCFADLDVLGMVRERIGDACPDLVYGDSFEADGTHRLYKPASSPTRNRYAMFTHHQAIFYRTRPAQAVGFDFSYRLICDWVMTTRLLARAGSNVLAIPAPICAFERGGVSQGKAMRSVFDRETFRIYREEQGHSLPMAAAYWAVKVGVNRVRSWLPSLYDRLRFRRAGAGVERPVPPFVRCPGPEGDIVR